MLDIQITRTTAPKPLPDPDKLVFGRTFTDHMFLSPSKRVWFGEEAQRSAADIRPQAG